MTQDTLVTFFGWTTLIHFAILLFASAMIFGLRDWVTRTHARLTGVDKGSLAPLYFQWMGAYKLLIFVFAFVPWLALTLM